MAAADSKTGRGGLPRRQDHGVGVIMCSEQGASSSSKISAHGIFSSSIGFREPSRKRGLNSTLDDFLHNF